MPHHRVAKYFQSPTMIPSFGRYRKMEMVYQRHPIKFRSFNNRPYVKLILGKYYLRPFPQIMEGPLVRHTSFLRSVQQLWNNQLGRIPIMNYNVKHNRSVTWTRGICEVRPEMQCILYSYFRYFQCLIEDRNLK